MPRFGLFIFAFSFLWGAQLFAHSVQGFVREAGTRISLPGATLVLGDDRIEAEADENGFFTVEIAEPVPETMNVAIYNYGHLPGRLEITLKRDRSSTDVAFFLTPDPSSSGETSVRERRRIDNQIRGSHRIEGKVVNEMAGTYGDPAKAIENFPGNGRVKRSQGSLFVRGAQPNQTAVYVDDFSVPDLYHFTGSTSVINIPFVESVELIPGVYSARFGRAVGGLVRLQTRKLPTDDVHGFAKIDLIDAGAYVGVPLSDKAAVGLSGRHSYLHLIREQQMASAEDSTDITLVPTYWDYQMKLDWDVSPGHELVVFGFGSGDRESYLRNASDLATAYQLTRNSDFHRLALRYKHPVARRTKNMFLAVVGYEERLTDEMWGTQTQGQQALDAQFREELNWKIGAHRMTAGIDATVREDTFQFGGGWSRSSVLGYDRLRLDPDPSKTNEVALHTNTFALFTEAVLAPIERWLWVPGLRLQAHQFDDQALWLFEPRLATDYVLSGGARPLTLKAGVGLFSQTAPEVQRAVARLEGERLPLQRSFQSQAGFEQQLNRHLRLRHTVYWIRREAQILQSELFPAAAFESSTPYTKDLDGQSMGLEILLAAQANTRHQAWLSYGLARHELLADNDNRVLLDSNDVTHFLVGVFQTQWDNGLRLGTRFRLSTGMPRTDVLTGEWSPNEFGARPVYGPINGARFENFGAVDLRLDYKRVYPWMTADFYLDLVNVFNLRPQEGMLYSDDYLQAQPLLGLPLIPNLGMKVVF